MTGTPRTPRADAAQVVAVFGVAGIAAYFSYENAFEVIAAHGETGMAAQLEPATVDGSCTPQPHGRRP